MDFQGEGKTSMRMLWESYKPTLSPGNRHRNPVLTDFNPDNIYDTLDFSRLILIADRGINLQLHESSSRHRRGKRKVKDENDAERVNRYTDETYRKIYFIYHKPYDNIVIYHHIKKKLMAHSCIPC